MNSLDSEKKLYLCSGCKKMGVRSGRSKVFETFNCPRCKGERTLFLPKSEVDKQAAQESTIHEPEPETASKPMVRTETRRPWLGLRDFFTFMLGFAWALFVMRYSR